MSQPMSSGNTIGRRVAVAATSSASPSTAQARPCRWRARIRLAAVRYGRAFGLIAAWLLTGCHAGIDNYLVRRAAEQRFALQNTCPVDRLSIERLAVEPRELLQARAPPADVAADSERLALWNNNANEALSRFMAMSGVRVRGCGCEASYVCWDQWTAGDEAEHLSPICYEIDEAMRSSAAISGLIPRPEGWHSLRTRLEVPAR